MALAYQTIEPSGFRSGEYVGHTRHGAVRIKKSRIGWHIYMPGCQAAYASPLLGYQRKTLRELDALIQADANKEGEAKAIKSLD